MDESKSNLLPEVKIPFFERDMYLKVFVTALLSHLLLVTKFTTTIYYKAGICYITVVRNTKLTGLHLQFKNTTQYTQNHLALD
jgi:hypothetical protein